MIIQTNIMAAPLLLLASGIDFFLFLAAVRLLFARFGGVRTAEVCSACAKITDPVPDALHGWLSRHRRRTTPRWLPWLMVFVLGVLARQLLILAALAIG